MDRARIAGLLVASLVVPLGTHAAVSESQVSILGRYSAVTESEWSVDLDIEADGAATYTFYSWEAGSRFSAKRSVTEARWELKGSLLMMSFPESALENTVTYKVAECLSYEVFGGQGCSLGLNPVSNEMHSRYSQPLWNSVGDSP